MAHILVGYPATLPPFIKHYYMYASNYLRDTERVACSLELLASTNADA